MQFHLKYINIHVYVQNWLISFLSSLAQKIDWVSIHLIAIAWFGEFNLSALVTQMKHPKTKYCIRFKEIRKKVDSILSNFKTCRLQRFYQYQYCYNCVFFNTFQKCLFWSDEFWAYKLLLVEFFFGWFVFIKVVQTS